VKGKNLEEAWSMKNPNIQHLCVRKHDICACSKREKENSGDGTKIPFNASEADFKEDPKADAKEKMPVKAVATYKRRGVVTNPNKEESNMRMKL
jgi:hypothetical protein